MAKQLKNIFSAGTDEIQQSFIINAAHVSQSTDAFTGVDDYSIAVSGTFQMVDGVATFATGDYLSGGGIVFSGQSGSVSSPPLTLYVSVDQSQANILGDREKLFIRNGNQSNGRGNVVIQVDQPGTSSTDIFEIAVFGSESLGTQLYHTGSLTFYTDSGSLGLGIVSTGYVSGSKAYLPQTENLSQDYVIGFDSTTGELTYFSTASFGGFNTGSLMITGSVTDNILTFTKGDGTTFNLTVDTGSGGGGGSVDTGSLLTTASISDATITFTKGDASTFDIEVNNVTSSISSSYADNGPKTIVHSYTPGDPTATITITKYNGGFAATSYNLAPSASYVANAFYTGSVLGNVLTFTQFDGDQSVLTVDTGSSLASGSVGNLQQVTDSGSITTNSITASAYFGSHSRFVPLTNGAAPTHQEGLVYYNSEDGALTVFNDEADISLQVGQEFWVRSFNSGSVTITNGTPVRISGSHGDRPVIWPAVAENHVTESFDRENHIIGVATHDIEAKSEGYVTAQGIVRGVDTSGFSAGDTLYLQTGSAGLRNTPPPFPYDVARVGFVTKVDNPNGFIFVDPKSPTDLQDISQVSGSVLTANIGDLLVRDANGGMVYTKTLSGSYTIDNGGLTADSFTGSLLGTASYALNTVSASYATTSSWSNDGVFSVSHVYNPSNSTASIRIFKSDGGVATAHYDLVPSASYVANAVSASYGPNIYNVDGTITDAAGRTVTLDQNGQTLLFDATSTGSRVVVSTVDGGGSPSAFRVTGLGSTSLGTPTIEMTNLSEISQSQVIGIDAAGQLSVMNTSSIASISSSYALTSSYGPNIYNINGNLSSARTLDFATNDLTFDMLNGETFQTVLDNEATHSIRVDTGMIQILPGTGFAELSSPHLLTYDTASGRVQYMSTASFGGGGSINTGSLMLTGSVAGNILTFTKGDGVTTFDLTVATGSGAINTGSFYISSSINPSGNTITFNQGDGTTESVTVRVNPGGVYDVTNRSTGNSQFSTALETIIGTTKIRSGSVNQSVRISEIANLNLGNQVHITATQYGQEGSFAKKRISVYETGGGTALPASINANGDITFEFDSAPTVDTPVMYHVIYTTDTP